MTTEQRLADALRAAGGYEASGDLWRRVVHSIEEDGAHRRRLLTALTSVAGVLLAAVAIAALSIQRSAGHDRIDWRV
ncbi:MAG: hypothetical protein OEM97_10680, partial [Acidimicrobiia bacterium]|nr:hypothetical protein [Acidimicrobiia bacterium]